MTVRDIGRVLVCMCVYAVVAAKIALSPARVFDLLEAGRRVREPWLPRDKAQCRLHVCRLQCQ